MADWGHRSRGVASDRRVRRTVPARVDGRLGRHGVQPGAPVWPYGPGTGGLAEECEGVDVSCAEVYVVAQEYVGRDIRTGKDID